VIHLYSTYRVTHLPTPGGIALSCHARPIPNPKPETRNPKPETRNPKPETRNPKPETVPLTLRPLNPMYRLGVIALPRDERRSNPALTLALALALLTSRWDRSTP